MRLKPETVTGDLLKIGFGSDAPTTVRGILAEESKGAGIYNPALLLRPGKDDPRGFIISFRDELSFSLFIAECVRLHEAMAELWPDGTAH